MHALIIEDIPVVALGLQMELEELGYATSDTAQSKAEALALAQRRCPDLIVADYRLVDGTGVEAVREICRDGPIPTVYVAGLVDEVLKDEPAATVLEKPVSITSLVGAVESVRRASASR